MTGAQRKTLQDIADAAGLSKAATSYALRGLRGSEATQARVRAIADELGYSADPIARALANGRSGNVAIVGSLRDLWRQGLAVMLSEALRAQELSSIIADVDGSPQREAAVLRSLAAQRVDGIIALPVDPSAEYWTEVPEQTRIVSIGDALTARPESESVLFDNEYGVGTALQHLADLGHRTVGLLAPTLPTTPGRPAELLAQSLGDSMGLSVTVSSSPSSVHGAAHAASQLLAGRERPTALFCLGDSIAFGAYRAARDLGLQVPADLSILGFDDSELASLVSPELTTFGWDEQAIVDAAVSALTMPEGTGTASGRVMFRPIFIDRESTAPPSTPSGPSH
ncbi:MULTISPECIES: LacI family DNA-binding transcriptional regulator [unclassified Arthrobacter]|uniref:LacI family DNA-binding transcriptional regulator n=1 Tax=unclassified Arthrobacter TaxID=235627 RepID=UPI0014928A6F|nr:MULTISPECIES: LacI family DNA-binding transcriptional regulator [unclassified Arthrobacter]MBE0010334.1 LacI family transcriptional regulator [Arthrobacter sp. AET 35A]NOJ64210.1 LacI family DNA-binding transcriptional regulator [Arthrobacter sp. 147(2020)]